jgi:predicted nucleic acid-binding protein
MSIFICDVNWAEVQYKMVQKRGADAWKLARSQLMALPIEHVPADQLLAESAAEIKAANKMSLADAFAAALAMQKKATLFTGDRDFQALEKEIKIAWLK